MEINAMIVYFSWNGMGKRILPIDISFFDKSGQGCCIEEYLKFHNTFLTYLQYLSK